MIAAHIVYWIGGLADYITTRKGLAAGFREGNPVVKYVLDRLPWDSELELLLLKVAVYAGLWVLGAPAEAFWVLGVLQFVAALWNFRLMRKAGVI